MQQPLRNTGRCTCQRPSGELPQLRQRLAQEEPRRWSQAIVREGTQDLAIAAEYTANRIGPAADPHPHQRALNVPNVNSVLLDPSKHQLEITGNSVKRIEVAMLFEELSSAEERRMGGTHPSRNEPGKYSPAFQ